MPTIPLPAQKSSLFSFACAYAAQTPPEGFRPEKLHLWLCRRIQQAIKNHERILITVPPQHGKSTVASVYAPVWYLWRNPLRSVGLISYSSELAESKSFQAQQLALRAGLKLHESMQSKSNWALQGALDSSFRARGVGGGITGNPIDFLILDDLIKNHEEAESKAYREKIWSYLESTISTRLTNKATVVSIMTRWHLDDYSSRLAKKWNWPLYNIPAICERAEGDLLERQPGEAAAPKLKSLDFLQEVKRNVSTYVFSALYQGNPTSHEATRIKREWFKYYPADKIDELSQKYNVYQTVDTSGTAEERSDYFVVLTFALVTKTLDGEILTDPAVFQRAKAQGRELIRCIYVLDVFRQKFETTEHESALQLCREKWRPVVQYVEKKTFGLNIIQNAKAKSLPVEPIDADQSKFLRSERISVYYKNGQVFHPDNAPWLENFEDEITTFPVAAHDDQFDCIAYAGIVAAKKLI